MRRRTLVIPRTLTAGLVLALAVACTAPRDAGSGSGRGIDDRTDPVPPPADPESLATDVDLTDLADTPVLVALAWVLWALEGDAPGVEVIERVMAPRALAELTPIELRTVLGQLAGTYRLTRLDQATPTRLRGEIDDGTRRWTLLLAVQDTDDLAIETLFFGRPLADPPDLADWGAGEAALGGVATQVAYLAARVEDDRCVPVAGADVDDRRPIASVAKLYVLGAVAEDVDAGRLAWDDVVTLQPDLVSLPTGRLQDEPPGTDVRVDAAAELMIAISDNTAADHLLHLVGRDAVEEALAAYGHGEPAVNRPFLTTRELFQLKWQRGEDERRAYLEADAAGRRALLESLAEEPLDVDPRAVTRPVEPHRLEWFASPAEVCAALARLDQRADRPGMEPIGHALGANPIVRLDADVWPRVAAKGGSEPGVLAFAFLLEAPDGDRWSLTVLLGDDRSIDESAAVPVVEALLGLLAEER